MKITYKETKNFSADDLKELFLSVNWASGKHCDKLVIAMKNSGTVYSAWDGKKLAGLVNVLDDSIMTAYIHYLLVNPEYQGNGIGKELMQRVCDKYKDYLRLVLIAYEREAEFYRHCGFKIAKGDVPMFITSLST